jgi:hypothetical protein
VEVLDTYTILIMVMFPHITKTEQMSNLYLSSLFFINFTIIKLLKIKSLPICWEHRCFEDNLLSTLSSKIFNFLWYSCPYFISIAPFSLSSLELAS